MFVSLVLLWLCLFFVILQLRPKRPKNFPPGPPALPILGNILIHDEIQYIIKTLDKSIGMSSVGSHN
uniref:Uncharacterized protein n=1 Tax=Acanthochromis polyacanthus TaxID=80966 RepID=A0A3Q1FRD7_9TELE